MQPVDAKERMEVQATTCGLRGPPLECLNRPRKRKYVNGLFCRLPTYSQIARPSIAREFVFPAQPSFPPPRKPAPQPHHIADDFRDRVIMLHRYLLIDLDRGV